MEYSVTLDEGKLVQGCICIRPLRLVKGQVVEGHEHNFGHVTYIVKGAARIKRFGQDGQVDEVTLRATDDFNWALIRAGVRHEITAIEDTLGHCVYAHRTPQGQVVQEFSGWLPAYQ